MSPILPRLNVISTSTFVSNSRFHYSIRNFKSLQLTRENDLSKIDSARVTFSPEHSASEIAFAADEVGRAVDAVLIRVPLSVSDHGRERLIKFAWIEADEAAALNFSPAGYVAVDLDILVQVEEVHVFDARFKKYEGNSRNVTWSHCCICLEDFSDDDKGGEAMALPCSHVFHGDCINEWLWTSRICSLCRFKMR